MRNETATATPNPTEAGPIGAMRSWAGEPAAAAAPEASTTLLATATSETDTQQQTQTTETPAATTTETPAAETKTEPVKTETPAAVVPEKYEFKAPEGTEFDPQVLESFSGAAKEAGLTQDAAQKLVEKMAPALAARQVDQVKAIHKEWTDASSADKEFGGEKLTENLGIARRALDTFDPVPIGADGKATSTPLRKLLDVTGLGNHPEVIRILFRAGKAISEDKFVAGKAGSTGQAANPANVLYDKTSKG